MRKSSTAFTALLIISMTLGFLALIQFPIKSVAIGGVIPAPAKGKSYTWNVLATNGPVSWYNFSSDPEHFAGVRTLVAGGTIQYNLTDQYPDNGYSFTGNVWYGNFSIFYNSSTVQVLNGTRVNCSTTEVGSNLALSAYGWLGGFVAPTNWTENFAEINAQPTNHTDTLLASNIAVIDYVYEGQVTHLEYDKTTGVLLYARTSFLGYNLEISLSGFSPAMPVASIAYDSSMLQANAPVQFWDESYGGTHPFTYKWSFGDSVPNGTAVDPVHVYSSPGTYNVTLTIIDSSARSSKVSILLVISEGIPTAPQGLQATGDAGQVFLQWQAPASNGGSPITNYMIYRGTNASVETYIATVGNVLNFTDSTVAIGQTYYYKVSAVNSIGTGSQSSVASATPSSPAIPGYPVVALGGILVTTAIAIPVLTKKKFSH